MKILAGVILSFSFFGCAGLGASSFDHVLASGQKKQAMLAKRVDQFHKAIYWKSNAEAAAMVAPEARASFENELMRPLRKAKIVEIEIDEIDFADDPEVVDVSVEIQYFEVPTYIVKTKIGYEKWRFERFAGGWLLHDVKTEVKDVPNS